MTLAQTLILTYPRDTQRPQYKGIIICLHWVTDQRGMGNVFGNCPAGMYRRMEVLGDIRGNVHYRPGMA